MAASGFANAVRAFAERTKTRATDVARESARALYREVVWEAPEASGYLRASVRLTSGAPARIVPGAPQPGRRYTPDLAAEFAAIASARLGEGLFVSVTAAHGPFVEYGTSRQPPNAFLRRTAMRWPAIVAGVTARLGSGRGTL